MREFFIVSYATKPGGHEHLCVREYTPVFVAGTDAPAFDMLPNAECVYFVTHIANFLEIRATYRRNKDTNQFDKQYIGLAVV